MDAKQGTAGTKRARSDEEEHTDKRVKTEGHADAVFGDLPTAKVKQEPKDEDKMDEEDQKPKVEIRPFYAHGMSHKGKKPYQQDQRLIVPNFRVRPKNQNVNPPRCAFFGIYDGHAGDYCSRYLADTLHLKLGNELTRYLSDTDMPPIEQLQRSLLQAYLKTDKELMMQIYAEKPPIPKDGSCATTALIHDAQCWLANVGDSKAVLGRRHSVKNEKIRAIRLTTDHSPMILSERKRIEGYYGYVDAEGRVMGQLGVSRSFGDYKTKKFGVIAQPALTKFTISKLDQFLLMASDGLWDVFSPEEAVNFIHSFLQMEQCKRSSSALTGRQGTAEEKERADPQKASKFKYEVPSPEICQQDCENAVKAIIEEAMLIRAGKDNTTIVLVIFG
mmetsp:Transcript_45951/g.73921  ORF Transcript_45951/g.73921 Transcript_45951/m.73921 type:complete len:388 (+) Transcript_45951:26-1189(+)|eukprot:jgi/Bigna1/89955/estExt_fgenesh1_pg.C_590015